MQTKAVVVHGSTVHQNSTCGSFSVAVWNLKIHQQTYHIGTFKSVGLSCVLNGSFIHTLFFKILCIDNFKNIGSLSTGWHNIKKKSHLLISPLILEESVGFGKLVDLRRAGTGFRMLAFRLTQCLAKRGPPLVDTGFIKLFFCLSVYALLLAMP